MNKKYRLIYDENLCIACQACSVACRVEHDLPDNFFRLQVRATTKGLFPNLFMHFNRISCVMCENPSCVDVCPTQASFVGKDGLVFVDERKCISCRYCILACAYEARFINPITNAVEKCDFCYETRVSKSLNPACVNICPTQALCFGDMQNHTGSVYTKSKASPLIFPKAHLRTFPKVAFVPAQRGEIDE